MLYATKNLNGYVTIYSAPPANVPYIEIDKLPDGEGPLAIDRKGNVYRLPKQKNISIYAPTEIEQKIADCELEIMLLKQEKGK